MAERAFGDHVLDLLERDLVARVFKAKGEVCSFGAVM